MFNSNNWPVRDFTDEWRRVGSSTSPPLSAVFSRLVCMHMHIFYFSAHRRLCRSSIIENNVQRKLQHTKVDREGNRISNQGRIQGVTGVTDHLPLWLKKYILQKISHLRIVFLQNAFSGKCVFFIVILLSGCKSLSQHPVLLLWPYN